jgi:endo-1,4-beta-xylanase
MQRSDQARLFAAGSAVVLCVVVVLVATRGVGPSSARADGATLPGRPAPVYVPPPDGLRSLAKARGLRIGTAVQADALASDARYRDEVAAQFSMVTPEDAMKWWVVQPKPGPFNWADADRIVDFAAQHGQVVRGHTLLWHNSIPGWVRALPRAQVQAAARQYVTAEVTHFRGKVLAWDVVNEPLDPDGTLRDNFWSASLGPNYVADVLRWAHAADPAAKLFVNEYGAEGINAKSNGLYGLMLSLKRQKVPIDGVGLQGHWGLKPVPPTMTANMGRFAALNLDIAITEADVEMPLPPNSTKLAVQATLYRQLLQNCLAVPRCRSFTVWGFTDRYSWIPGAHSGSGAACLLDTQMRPKPAFTAVASTLKR